MITKEKIKELLTILKEFEGKLTLIYIPMKRLTIEGLYHIYYGGWNKMQIGEYYVDKAEAAEITESNVDEITDKIYANLNECIGHQIMEALDNLEMDAEDLKYFDRDPVAFERFKEEVLKLKNEI